MDRTLMLFAQSSSVHTDPAGHTVIHSTHPPKYIPGPYSDALPTDRVPPLVELCIRALAPFADQVHQLPVRLHLRTRALLDDLIPDPANIDPRLWATIVQVYSALPPAFASYTIPLADTHLPLLQSIPSSPSFALLTLLNIPSCPHLTDETIPQLRFLHSLTAFDAAHSQLTPYGVKALAAILQLDEHTHRGPWQLRVLSLRNCKDITNDAFPHLYKFPLLSVIDLRGTRCIQQPDNPFQPSSNEHLYHPASLATALTHLHSLHPNIYPCSTPYMLNVNSLHHRPTRKVPKADITPEDAFVVIPSNNSRIKIGNSHILARQIERRDEALAHERNKDAWYERQERIEMRADHAILNNASCKRGLAKLASSSHLTNANISATHQSSKPTASTRMARSSWIGVIPPPVPRPTKEKEKDTPRNRPRNSFPLPKSASAVSIAPLSSTSALSKANEPARRATGTGTIPFSNFSSVSDQAIECGARDAQSGQSSRPPPPMSAQTHDTLSPEPSARSPLTAHLTPGFSNTASLSDTSSDPHVVRDETRLGGARGNGTAPFLDSGGLGVASIRQGVETPAMVRSDATTGARLLASSSANTSFYTAPHTRAAAQPAPSSTSNHPKIRPLSERVQPNPNTSTPRRHASRLTLFRDPPPYSALQDALSKARTLDLDAERQKHLRPMPGGERAVVDRGSARAAGVKRRLEEMVQREVAEKRRKVAEKEREGERESGMGVLESIQVESRNPFRRRVQSDAKPQVCAVRDVSGIAQAGVCFENGKSKPLRPISTVKVPILPPEMRKQALAQEQEEIIKKKQKRVEAPAPASRKNEARRTSLPSSASASKKPASVIKNTAFDWKGWSGTT
ncbi:hypothetical protein B0H34DRAFT_795019 [Crassisporium funariophilum]|nr:hypothetical protein B0H34DRAFT_795019 [Crassisporium funariophilum]